MGKLPGQEGTAPEAGGGSAAVAEPGSADETRRSAKRKAAANKMAESRTPDHKRGGPQARRPALQVYKPNQGTYTRWGTFAGAGILILAGADFLYDQLGVFRSPDQSWTLWLQVGIPLVAVAGLGFAVYWISFVNRKACDFMIATEGEMKKVSWSSRREIIGSTKVVIAFTLLLTLVLFVVDLIFMAFFSWINVLKGAPSVWELLTGGGT